MSKGGNCLNLDLLDYRMGRMLLVAGWGVVVFLCLKTMPQKKKPIVLILRQRFEASGNKCILKISFRLLFFE